MNEPFPDVVLDVAQQCYERHAKLPPGSEDADATERAISMALSTRRPPKEARLLLGDVLRNGRHSTRRSRARHLRAVDEAGHLATRGIPTGGTRGFIDTETPDQIIIAQELERTLEAEARSCGPHGPRILHGLLAGETTATVAIAAGVSITTVNRTIRRLREAILHLGYLEAA